jgi:hypothetical protein
MPFFVLGAYPVRLWCAFGACLFEVCSMFVRLLFGVCSVFMEAGAGNDYFASMRLFSIPRMPFRLLQIAIYPEEIKWKSVAALFPLRC